MTTTPKRPIFSAIVIAALSLASPLFSHTAHANLVVNGDFETGVTQTQGFGGTAVGGADTVLYDGTLAGWNTGPSNNSPNAFATNNHLYYATDSNGDPAPVPPPGGPHAGNVSVVFPNTPDHNGYISQVIHNLTVGQTYEVSFWLSNQIGDFGSANTLKVRWGGFDTGNGITDNGGLNPFTDIWGPTTLTVPLGWTQYTAYGVALAADQSLSFIGGNDAAGNLLDDVVVVVPEVSSFGMLTGFGLLAFGATARFRRRSLATA